MDKNYKFAEKLFRNKYYDKAIYYYSKTNISKDIDFYCNIYIKKGFCYFFLNKIDKAKYYFKKTKNEILNKGIGLKFYYSKFPLELFLLFYHTKISEMIIFIKYFLLDNSEISKDSFYDFNKIIDFSHKIDKMIKSKNIKPADMKKYFKTISFLKEDYAKTIHVDHDKNLFIDSLQDFPLNKRFTMLVIKYNIMKLIYKAFNFNKNNKIIMKNTIKLFSDSIISDSIDLIKQKEQEKAQVIIEERDKVIADLSHSIKNLIATVKDPLENLRAEAKEYTKTIDDAINGTNLIRGIVNAMNLSYVGSIEDFYEDAKSEDENKIDLKDIIINAVISAVPNMFDKKYFNDFQKRYFPTREIFIEATSEWQKVSQKKETKEIIDYLNKYMFDIKLDFVNIDGLTLSDKKGSVVKMMILAQEMVLNAIKYSSFVDRDRRIVNIRLEKSDKIKFEIENRYKKDIVTKKSGLGHVIINNFAKLLKTEPLITINDDIFKIELNIPDLWR